MALPDDNKDGDQPCDGGSPKTGGSAFEGFR